MIYENKAEQSLKKGVRSGGRAHPFHIASHRIQVDQAQLWVQCEFYIPSNWFYDSHVGHALFFYLRLIIGLWIVNCRQAKLLIHSKNYQERNQFLIVLRIKRLMFNGRINGSHLCYIKKKRIKLKKTKWKLSNNYK